jgi:peptide/nickel transport system substrate-binding protein
VVCCARKIFVSMIVAALSLCLLPGCGKPKQSAKVRNTYRMSLNANPDSLDPAYVYAVVQDGVVRQIFNGLVDLDERLIPVPDLAESWEISDDQRTYTFHLRKGVKFHNGREMTSADVRYSFERLLLPKIASMRAFLVADIEGAQAVLEGKATTLEGLATPDSFTVIITLTKPVRPFLAYLAMSNAAIIPKEAVDESFGQNPVGTGPFKFVEWVTDSQIELVRFDEYYDGPAKLDGINFSIIVEPAAAYKVYQAGKLDHCRVPPSYDMDKVKSCPEAAELVAQATLDTYYLGITMTKVPFGKEIHLRRALGYVIDRGYICRKVYGDSRMPARGIVPPGLPSYNPNLKPLEQNLELAKAELAKAGYSLAKPTPPVDIYHKSSSESSATAQVIQQQCAKIGMTIKLRSMDLGALGAATGAGQAPIFLLGWVADYPDAENFLGLFHSSKKGANGNRAHYSNPKIDALLDKSLSEADAAKRIALNRKIEKLVLADAPWVPLFHGQTRLFVKPYVKNFTLTAMDADSAVSRVDFHKVELVRE